MGQEIDLKTELGDIVDQLTSQGVPASLDRDKVAVPGVWVTAAGIELDGLNFYTIHARLIVIVPDSETPTVVDQFSTTVNAILTLFAPDGELTPVTVNRAGGPLPALAVPVDFRADYPPDTP